jgi:hypothetical protein
VCGDSRERSRAERGPEAPGEFFEERVRFLLDHRLTELADLAEAGDVGLDAQAGARPGSG